jgi:hypothetical protein
VRGSRHAQILIFDDWSGVIAGERRATIEAGALPRTIVHSCLERFELPATWFEARGIVEIRVLAIVSICFY